MEKKTKHTPAPWHIMSAQQMSVPYIVYVGNETIFHCYNTCEEEDAKANALLIASAPEMLSFIQKLVDDYYNERIGDFEEIIEQAHELIQKATGDE